MEPQRNRRMRLPNMGNAKRVLFTFFLLAGCACGSLGTFLINVPAGFIATGVLAIVFGLVTTAEVF